ncbi:netrin-5 isoform X1 [Pantherophis guttatus]|uniref:Netrin-1 n=1 Tax=Pantherophis guttatus TaxID=94885 RepID=A0A6P9BV74_PANGU|nr:netrin-5 isoform X1 [Pantherophis guttatus]
MLPFPWGVAVFLPFLLGQTPDPHDPCYNANQRPQFCLPELSELASGRLVEASSTCSGPPGRFCAFRDSTNPASKFCQGCQEHTHGSERLTDSDGDTTCWWSQPTANATLTLALGRRMEILYVALRFCSPRPESLAIYKSMDYGRSWMPFQFFSSHCWRRYRLPPTTTIVKSMEHEAVCIEAQTALKPLTGGLVAFMPLAGRPSAQRFEYSPILQDWVTATDLRMSFDRMHSARILGMRRKEAAYGVAELQVGGRCKCNGHASRCTAGKDGGVLQCDCRHHTAGPECDTCKTFYWDRPWQRATPKDAHECVACNCHRHSHRCRFSMELFELSGRQSGGICLNCRHHTAGRHCQYCSPGFKRDFNHPITSHRACKACQCHPIGATGAICNQTTGQCQCKNGVTGLTCNRCAQGFQQSHSAHVPCIRIQEEVTTTVIPPQEWKAGTECQSHCTPPQKQSVHMNLKNYCKKDYVLQAQLLAIEKSGTWWQFTASILTVYRQRHVPIRRGEQPLWVPEQDLACRCLHLQVGKSYLIIGNDDESPDPARLILDKNSLALPWRDAWAHKLRSFQQQSKRGKCWGV